MSIIIRYKLHYFFIVLHELPTVLLENDSKHWPHLGNPAGLFVDYYYDYVLLVKANVRPVCAASNEKGMGRGIRVKRYRS